ncbi:MAG: alpha/beta fold hydrolase [Gemmatirosa sp.]
MSPATEAIDAVDATVPAADGTRLVQRTWPAAAGVPAAGALLLVHGLGEHARRYDHVARAIAALGIEVRSYDQRGFGRSHGPRATLPHADALLDDAALLFTRLADERRARGDDRPPLILGHSMGGCVVARAVTGGWIRPRGMVLSSPALIPRVSRLDGLAARLGNRFTPNLRVPNRLPMGHVSHDPDVVAAIAADAEMHDRVTPRLVTFMLTAGRRAIEDAARCEVPTLLQIAGSDRFVDPEGAVRFHARLPAGVGTLRRYDALYHEIYNERPADRATVLDDLVAWLRAHRTGPRDATGPV